MPGEVGEVSLSARRRTMVDGSFVVTEARAYLDTITLFSWQPLPKQIFKDVRGLQNKPLVSRETLVRGRDGCHLTCLLFNFIHQPTAATMEYLAPMQDDKFTLNAVHVAFDFLVADEQQALNAQSYFGQHLRQTWRRPQEGWSGLNTSYWKLDRKEPRNIALYSDRPSKTGGGHCCHLELRFTGADGCRRSGLSDLHALASGIDALSLLKRQTKISIVDPDRLDRVIERMARHFLPRTKRDHRIVIVNGARTELTVDLLTAKMHQLLVRSLGVAPITRDSVCSIRSQDLWDSQHRALRSALVEVPWDEIAPPPSWYCWR
jgi:hypothetical protein